MQTAAAPASPSKTVQANEKANVQASNHISVENNDTAFNMSHFPAKINAYNYTRCYKYNKHRTEKLERQEAKVTAAHVYVDELRKLEC